MDKDRVAEILIEIGTLLELKGENPFKTRAYENAARALESLGAGLSDVVRTRVLLTRIEDWEAVARVHGEFFADVRPANTVVQVVRFIEADWLVEVEADAVVGD